MRSNARNNNDVYILVSFIRKKKKSKSLNTISEKFDQYPRIINTVRFIREKKNESIIFRVNYRSICAKNIDTNNRIRPKI